MHTSCHAEKPEFKIWISRAMELLHAIPSSLSDSALCRLGQRNKGSWPPGWLPLYPASTVGPGPVVSLEPKTPCA